MEVDGARHGGCLANSIQQFRHDSCPPLGRCYHDVYGFTLWDQSCHIELQILGLIEILIIVIPRSAGEYDGLRRRYLFNFYTSTQ